MNYYETLYIVHPALDAGRLKDIIMGIEDSLKKMGGDPLAVELWGKRKLAYFIDKQKYGTYVLLQYNGEGKCTNDFAIELEHNPNILAYITTVIDLKDVLEMEEDLETQIAGKTREAERSESAKRKESSSERNKEASRGDNELEEPTVTDDAEKDEKEVKQDSANAEEDVNIEPEVAGEEALPVTDDAEKDEKSIHPE